MLKEPKQEEKPSTGQIIAGALLTLIAVPFLLVATCIPALGINGLTNMPDLSFVVWVLATVGIGIWRAIVTKNPGVRWAIVVIIAAAVVFAVLLLSPNLFGIHF